MPTLKKRISLTLSPDKESRLEALAEFNNQAVATYAVFLLEEALEWQEDRMLERYVEPRLKSKKFVSHDEVWKSKK